MLCTNCKAANKSSESKLKNIIQLESEQKDVPKVYFAKELLWDV